jgi:hypothetical protein
VLLVAGLALITSTPAYASSILPGQSGVVPSVLPNPGNPPLIFDSGQQFFTFGPAGLQVTVAYEAYVALDPFSPHLYPCGGNCIDFALDVELVSGPAGAITTLNSVAIGGFGGANAAIDVDYLFDASSALVPSTANRSASPGSGLITFNYAGFNVPLEDSKTLVLRTDLTSWNGGLGLTFMTTVAFPAVTFNPGGTVVVSTPEPSSILLLGTGALFVLLRRKRA